MGMLKRSATYWESCEEGGIGICQMGLHPAGAEDGRGEVKDEARMGSRHWTTEGQP